MAFQECPGIAQFNLHFTQDGQVAENVFHLMKSGVWSASDLEEGTDSLWDWITDHWPAVASVNASAVGVGGVDLSSDSGASFEKTIADPIPGGVATVGLPTSVTVAVSWKTAKRGRSYRGRTFHVGIPAAMTLDSALTTTAQGLLVTAYTYLLATFVANGQTMCVLSRRHNGELRAQGIGTPITTLAVDANLDSQRRRLPGRGV